MPATSDAMLRDNYHEIKKRYTCLEEVLYPKKHLKRDGQIRTAFFFLLRCGYQYQHFGFGTVS